MGLSAHASVGRVILSLIQGKRLGTCNGSDQETGEMQCLRLIEKAVFLIMREREFRWRSNDSPRVVCQGDAFRYLKHEAKATIDP